MTIDKRINFRGGGMDRGNASNQAQSASMGNTTSRNTSSGTGGSKGNLGGGGGGQGTDYRQYSPPVCVDLPNLPYFKGIDSHAAAIPVLKAV